MTTNASANERGDVMVRPQDKTVLVVDDEPNVRDYLAQILLDAGFNVLTAEGGERWRDAGYLLLPVIALIGLAWSRKGWLVS